MFWAPTARPPLSTPQWAAWWQSLGSHWGERAWLDLVWRLGRDLQGIGVGDCCFFSLSVWNVHILTKQLLLSHSATIWMDTLVDQPPLAPRLVGTVPLLPYMKMTSTRAIKCISELTLSFLHYKARLFWVVSRKQNLFWDCWSSSSTKINEVQQNDYR